jgi:ubiquinol-cytochrome c reductase cytochrome b subunit
VTEELEAPRVEVWQQRDGEWRWRYVGVVEEDGEPLRLLSNEPESSEDEAVSAAQLAYPGVPVHVLGGAPDEQAARTAALDEVPGPHRWIWRSATLALALALAATAVRYRRWWAAPLAPLLAHGIVTHVRRSLP